MKHDNLYVGVYDAEVAVAGSAGDNWSSGPFQIVRCMLRPILKRALDVVVAAILLGILAAPALVLSAIVFCSEPGPVIFAHRRIGFRGKTFLCFKLRTMRLDADRVLKELLAHDSRAREEWAATRKIHDDPRVTFIGKFLRKTSLDELPQLYNVLRGDMSLVGPRPVVIDELNNYYTGGAAEAYMSVRPGLTGLWQVSGRSNIGYEQRVAIDCKYVNNLSIRRDLGLLMRTPYVVLRRTGAR